MFFGENHILLSFIFNNSLKTVKRMLYLYMRKLSLKELILLVHFSYIIFWQNFYFQIFRTILTTYEITYMM